jgi:hypothetical protein
MDIGLVLTPLVLISVVIFVAWPLLTEKREFIPLEGTALEIAQQEKDNAISNLKDIEMDFRMGKLSEEDYQVLREDFKLRAMKAIERLESVQKKRKTRKAQN